MKDGYGPFIAICAALTLIPFLLYGAAELRDYRESVYDKAYDAGYSQGVDDTEDAAYCDGYADGYTDGYADCESGLPSL